MSALELRVAQRTESGFYLDIDAEFPLRGVTALLGASASGKASVLDCIAGLRRDLRAAVLIVVGALGMAIGVRRLRRSGSG